MTFFWSWWHSFKLAAAPLARMLGEIRDAGRVRSVLWLLEGTCRLRADTWRAGYRRRVRRGSWG
jgi:hypothetical protein